MGQSSAEATEILDYIAGQISETQLGQDLKTEIDKISGDGIDSVNERIGEAESRLDGSIGNLAGDIGGLNLAVGDLSASC